MSLQPFKVAVPGSTSNLGSGFDTISAALTLFLRVQVTPQAGRDLVWEGDVPDENILARAFLDALRFMSCDRPGLRIEVENPIPLGRGLGSSGAAIVAGIRMAQQVAGRSLTTEEVMQIAMPLEGHPDNLAASLLGGWVLSRSSGAGVQCEKIESPLQCHFILAVPDVTVSTQRARRILPTSYSLEDAVFNLQRCALFVHALHTGKQTLLREATGDRLHQSYRAGLVPGLDALLEFRGLSPQLQGSLLSITISGSGSTVLAMAESQTDALAAWMQETLGSHGTEAEVLTLGLSREGVQLSC